jgi:hypothetical protein
MVQMSGTDGVRLFRRPVDDRTLLAPRLESACHIAMCLTMG